MFFNNLKIAFRNLTRRKLYTIINIAGLSIGLACCLLIIGFVNNELTFESYHDNKDRIYRVDGLYSIRDTEVSMASIMPALGPALGESISEIEKVARIYRFWDLEIEIPDGNELTVEKAFAAEPEYLEIFTFPLKYGNAEHALAAPYSALISEDLAKRYFPESNPIGQTIKVNDEYELNITGIICQTPKNSQLRSDLVMSYSTLEEIGIDTKSWTELFSAYTYVLLNENSDPTAIEKKIPEIIAANIGTEEAKFYKLKLQPLKDIYLNSNLSYELPPTGDIEYIYIFSIVAALLLLIACLNFINLNTSQVSRRIREVGIRKVLGAFRSHLIRQYLIESLLLTTASMLVGVALMEIAQPRLETFLERRLEINILSDPTIIISILAMIFIVGVMSGSYPAYVLSRFTPAAILRGGILGSSSKSFVRKIFVTVQFMIAIGLLCCTFEIYHQINYAFNTDLGFDRENIVLLNFSDENITAEQQNRFKNEILMSGAAFSASSASCVPGEGRWALYSITPENKADQDPTFMHGIVADQDFIGTFGLTIIEGDNFSVESFAENTHQLIINRAALKQFEIENPIGFNLFLGETAYRIVGVVDDFHMHSLHSEIMPIGIFPAKSKQRIMAIKLPEGGGREALSRLKQTWEATVPGIVFDYSYLDDVMAEGYRDDRRLGLLFTVFSLLTVLVSCLGLFGLAAFNTEQRTKEIGIRKVLGASISNILILLSREIIGVVLIANALAWPVAYFALTEYLESFAYHDDIRWLLFALSGMLALIIALATMSFQTVKAALSNPVETLRYE